MVARRARVPVLAGADKNEGRGASFHRGLAIIAFLVLVVCVSVALASPATYYVDYVGGSDANDGLAKTTGGGHGAWQHVPGMKNATGVAAAYTMTAGDSIILKGGVTWPMNTTGCWQLPAGHGTAGNPVYFGVDQTWYTGGAWTRPILNGNGVSIGACQAITTNNFLFIAASYITIDNFEFTGGRAGSTSGCSGVDGVCDSYIFIYSGGNPTNTIIENTYMHGVTTANPNCSVSGCQPWVALYNATQAANYGNSLAIGNVIDGSDSGDYLADPSCTGVCESELSGIEGNWWELSENIVRYVDEGYDGVFNLVHDSLIEWIRASNNTSSGAHANGIQYDDAPYGCAVYDNVVRHTNPVNGVNARGVQTFGISNKHLTNCWVFGNDVYDTTVNNQFNVWYTSSDHSARGSQWVFNNTVAGGPEGAPNDAPGGASCVTAPWDLCWWDNNHVITNATSGPLASCTTNCTDGGHSIFQTLTAANGIGQGYFSSSTYAYSPGFLTSITVGAGANLASLCTTISATNAAAGTACLSDTTYGVSYNTSNHTATFPARTVVARIAPWSVGAYQVLTRLLAPLNLSLSAH